MTSWSWRNAPLEAMANIRVNRLRHAIVGLLIGGGVFALLYSELSAAQGSLDTLRALNAAGRSVYIVEPVVESGRPLLNSARCDHLSRLPQVRAAGGLTFVRSVEFERAPGTPFRLYLATGQFTRVVDPTQKAAAVTNMPNVWVAREAMSQAGLRAGENERTRSGEQVRVHSFNPSRRHPLGALMVVALSRAQSVEQCWFELRNPDLPGATELAATEFTASNLKVTVRSAQDANVFIRDPVNEFRRRRTRHAWLVFGLVTSSPGLLVMWFTRQNAALYRSLRAGRVVTWAVTVGEASAIILWGVALGSSAALIVAVASGTVESASAVVGLRAVAKSAVVALLSTALVGVLATRGRLTDQLKDR